MTVSKYALIVLSLVIMLRCIRSMLSDRYEPETWASVRFGRESVPVTHWETWSAAPARRTSASTGRALSASMPF